MSVDNQQRRFYAEALNILPVGQRVTSVTDLRLAIADIIARRVDEALARQLENHFPEVLSLREGLKAARDNLDLRLLEVKAQKQELEMNQAKLLRLVQAFRDYFAWCNGLDGEVDEIGKRWQNLNTAYQNYIGKEKIDSATHCS